MPHLPIFISQLSPRVGIGCVKTCDVAVFLRWEEGWWCSRCMICFISFRYIIWSKVSLQVKTSFLGIDDSPMTSSFLSLASSSSPLSSLAGVLVPLSAASKSAALGRPLFFLCALPAPFLAGRPPSAFFFFPLRSYGSPFAFKSICSADKKPSPPDTLSLSRVRICLTFFLTPVVDVDPVRTARRVTKWGFLNGLGTS